MPKILIVDDDKDFAQACEEILKKEGYETVLADSVVAAEAVIKKGGLNLILLDIVMENPDDGIVLAHKLKKDCIGVPIVMLSDVSKATGYEYGKCNEALPCTDFLEKPVKPEDLISKIGSILNKSKE